MAIGGRKAGRNKEKCKRYKMLGKRERNKERKAETRKRKIKFGLKRKEERIAAGTYCKGGGN